MTPSDGWLGDAYAERKLKMACGEVSYGRAHLIREGGGTGFHPLDVALGLTRDGFSPWVVQFVTRLATRMSYSASRLICKAGSGGPPQLRESSTWCWVWAGRQRRSCNRWGRRRMTARYW